MPNKFLFDYDIIVNKIAYKIIIIAAAIVSHKFVLSGVGVLSGS